MLTNCLRSLSASFSSIASIVRNQFRNKEENFSIACDNCIVDFQIEDLKKTNANYIILFAKLGDKLNQCSYVIVNATWYEVSYRKCISASKVVIYSFINILFLCVKCLIVQFYICMYTVNFFNSLLDRVYATLL